MDNLDEQRQVEAVLKGDSSAYRFLVEGNKKIVYSIAFRLLNNAADAEDAAQESFIKAYHQLHTFKGKSKFSTWIYTITYRICVSKLKKSALEKNTVSAGKLETEIDKSNDPHRQLTEKENQQLIKESIDRLPKLDALLVTLYYFNENPIAEIEQITGLSASNIKIRLFRARKMLEQELKLLI